MQVNNPPASAGDMRCRFDPQVRKIPWRRAWQPTPVFLPGESHGQRSLAGYSPWGRKQSDMTEGLNSSRAESRGAASRWACWGSRASTHMVPMHAQVQPCTPALTKPLTSGYACPEDGAFF